MESPTKGKKQNSHTQTSSPPSKATDRPYKEIISIQPGDVDSALAIAMYWKQIRRFELKHATIELKAIKEALFQASGYFDLAEALLEVDFKVDRLDEKVRDMIYTPNDDKLLEKGIMMPYHSEHSVQIRSYFLGLPYQYQNLKI